jgi:hypothetical protein
LLEIIEEVKLGWRSGVTPTQAINFDGSLVTRHRARIFLILIDNSRERQERQGQNRVPTHHVEHKISHSHDQRNSWHQERITATPATVVHYTKPYYHHLYWTYYNHDGCYDLFGYWLNVKQIQASIIWCLISRERKWQNYSPNPAHAYFYQSSWCHTSDILDD